MFKIFSYFKVWGLQKKKIETQFVYNQDIYKILLTKCKNTCKSNHANSQKTKSESSNWQNV